MNGRSLNQKKLKVGIIGANWGLKFHSPAWRLFEDVEIAAVCTAHRETAEAAAQKFGIEKAYWNIADLMADPNIDIIDVGGRPSYRYNMVMAAIASGKHVYNALPFAMNIAQARSMLDAQREQNIIGVIDAQFRHMPAVMHMKELIDEGFIGMPLGFNVQLMMPLINYDQFTYPLAAWPEGGMSPYPWLGDIDSGASGWRNFGAHATLLLAHLLGPVEEICGELATGIKLWKFPDGSRIEPTTHDLGCATLKLANGAIGNLQTGWCTPDAVCLRVEVWGDMGRLQLVDTSFGNGVSARLYAGDGRLISHGSSVGDWVDIPERFYKVPGTGLSKANARPFMMSMARMFYSMKEAIAGRAAASPNFAEALHAQMVVAALDRSQQTREKVRINQM